MLEHSSTGHLPRLQRSDCKNTRIYSKISTIVAAPLPVQQALNKHRLCLAPSAALTAPNKSQQGSEAILSTSRASSTTLGPAGAVRSVVAPASSNGWHQLDNLLWEGTEQEALNTNLPLSPSWKVLLLSDGSVTRHLQLLTSSQVAVDCLEMCDVGDSVEGLLPFTHMIPGSRVRRQVLLRPKPPVPPAAVFERQPNEKGTTAANRSLPATVAGLVSSISATEHVSAEVSPPTSTSPSSGVQHTTAEALVTVCSAAVPKGSTPRLTLPDSAPFPVSSTAMNSPSTSTASRAAHDSDLMAASLSAAPLHSLKQQSGRPTTSPSADVQQTQILATALTALDPTSSQVVAQAAAPLVYATSWWAANEVDSYLTDRSQPIWVSLSKGHVELYREVQRLYYGHSAALEEKFGCKGPFWGRQYFFWHEGKPLTLIYEVFSNKLEEFLGPQQPQ